MAIDVNFFIILGLGEYKPDQSFVDMSLIGAADDDPAVSGLIKSAIDGKRQEWSKDVLNNPRKAATSQRYIELIPDIESKLKTVSARQEMYNDAKDKVIKILKKPLAIRSAKGYITNEEIDSVAKQCDIPASAVKNFVSVEIREKKETGEILKKPASASKFRDNDSRMQPYGFNDLYAFLCEGTGRSRKSFSQANDCLERAKEIKDGLPDHIKQQISDYKKICEFCISTVFVSEDSKKEYDEYLAWKQINDILMDVKDATDVTKKLSKEQGRDFIDEIQSAGADKAKAVAYLRGYCDEKGIVWDSEDAGQLSTLVRCPYCPSMVDPAARHCPTCGGEIIIACPKCGRDHSVRDRYCANADCRYDFNNFKRAVALCEKAKAAIDVLDLQLAKVVLDEAEELCSTVKEIASLRTQWQQQYNRYGTIAEKIKTNADNKLFVTAKRDLDALKNQFPQYNNPELEEAISSGYSLAETALNQAKQESDPTRAIRHALTAYQSCKDYPGVQEILSSVKPPEVTAVKGSADPVKRANIITWNVQKNELSTFKILKKTGSKPISADDVDKSWEIASDSFVDNEINPNVEYYYAIVSCIGPVSSALFHCETPLMSFFDVQQLTVQNNKGTVSARWTNVPQNGEVEVWRSEAGDPEKPGSGTKVSNVNVTEMVDQGLDNDKTYFYRVFIKYRKGNDFVYSNGVSFTGLPTAPPRAIDYVVVKHERDNTFSIEWDADEGENVAFYITSNLSVQQEQMIEVAELSKVAIRANINLKGDNTGEFDLPDSQMYYVFPVTQKNTSAIVGAIVPVTSQKLITVNKVQLSGKDVIIRFNWPEGISHILLLYRNDRYPVVPGDTGARRIRVAKAVFDQKQAISISNLPMGTYYFSLFAELNVSGAITYSVPEFHTFRFGTKSKVVYNIKAQKFLGKLKSVEVIINPPDDGVLPPLIVVANTGAPPAFKHQGNMVGEYLPGEATKKPAVLILSADNLSSNTYIKVFTRDDEDAANFTVSLQAGSSAKLG